MAGDGAGGAAAANGAVVNSGHAAAHWVGGAGPTIAASGDGDIPAPPARRRRRWLAARQAVAMIRKNILMRMRFPGLLVGQMLSAVAFVGLIWLVDAATRYSDASFGGRHEELSPSRQRVGPMPLCTSSPLLQHGVPCYTFIYTPAGDPWIEELVAGVMAANQPPIPPEQARGFSNMSEVDTYLWEHPQTVLAAVHFRRRPQPPNTLGSPSPRALSFVVQSNATASYFKGRFQDPNTYVAIPLQVAVEAQMARLATADPSLQWSVSLADFPHPSLTTTSVVGRFAPTFLLASVVINFVVLLTNMVAERETGTRSALAAMGLRDSAHWMSWVIPELMLTCAHSAVLLAALVAMRFPLALRNSPALLFLLLWGSEMSMSAVALVLSTLLHRSASAVPAGFATYIVCWALQLVVQFGFPYRPGVARGWVGFFSSLPPCLLTKGLQDLANAALGGGRGIPWSHRLNYCWVDPPAPAVRAALPYWQSNCIMPVGQVVWLLPIQAAGFTLLAIYLDGVLPREVGVSGLPLWAPVLKLLPRGLLGTGERSVKARSARRAAAALQRAVLDQQLLLALQQQQQGRLARNGSARQQPKQPHQLPIPHTDMRSDLVAATAPQANSIHSVVRSPGLHDLQKGCIDRGVAAEAVIVQAVCRRFIVDAQQVSTANTTKASPASSVHAPYSEAGPVADRVSNRAGRDGPGADDAAVPLGSVAGACVGAVAAQSSIRANHRHCNEFSAGFNAIPDWRETVVLFGLRKEYRSRSWLTAAASLCNDWLQRRRRKWRPAVDEPIAAAAGNEDDGGVLPFDESALRQKLKTATGGHSGPRVRGRHVAVYGTWLRITPGECFCLLGPNGAGKTTTIKCLTGAIRPTSGEALVYGTSVLDPVGLDSARAQTGICPQFDVLWGALSGREHLELMADVRGLPWSRRRDEVEAMLKQVRLEAAADRPAKSYSGGMRRRLSVAAALLGDPRVIYLDEPTTGMDPVSRNHVWELISSSKAGRCLVLTTHSMEEAEVLGDRIAILAAGRLRCLGNSLALKRRYGGGYRLSVGLQDLVAMTTSTAPADDATAGSAAARKGTTTAACSGRAGGGGDDGGSGAIGASSSTSSNDSHGDGLYSAGDGNSVTGGIATTTAKEACNSVALLERLVADSLGLVEGQVTAEWGRSHLHFQVPRAVETRLPELFEQLKANGCALGIIDVQIKLSSLEDVYLEVVQRWR